MSTYALNKMIREINREPVRRDAYFAAPTEFVRGYDLTADEAAAFLAKDIGRLYKLGVHGLILRPFTLINKMSEPDYLAAIRS